MRVASNREEVEKAKAQRSAPLSLDGALGILAAPRLALSSGALERYPFLESYSEKAEDVERVARKLDEMPESERLGFLREFAITAVTWLEVAINLRVKRLAKRAHADYDLDLASDATPYINASKLYPKLYPDEWASIIEMHGTLRAREAKLSALEEEVCLNDVSPGREHGSLSSMLSEDEMGVPLAELRRKGTLGPPTGTEWYEQMTRAFDLVPS